MTLNNNNKIFQATFENVVELSLQKVEDDDNELINFIKRHRLKSPKPREVEYNLAGQPLGRLSFEKKKKVVKPQFFFSFTP